MDKMDNGQNGHFHPFYAKNPSLAPSPGRDSFDHNFLEKAREGAKLFRKTYKMYNV